MKEHDVQLKNVAKLMFEKYWSECSLILAITVVLDPRYKLQFVDWSYKKFYGNDSNKFQTVHINFASKLRHRNLELNYQNLY